MTPLRKNSYQRSHCKSFILCEISLEWVTKMKTIRNLKSSCTSESVTITKISTQDYKAISQEACSDTWTLVFSALLISLRYTFAVPHCIFNGPIKYAYLVFSIDSYSTIIKLIKFHFIFHIFFILTLKNFCN